MFVFGGRRANLELQLPFIDRLLEDYPNLEYHLWDLAKDSDDSDYILSLGDHHPRLVVQTKFSGAGVNYHKHFNDVYQHYAPPVYEDCVFVKLDDDVVFIETGRFDFFLREVQCSSDKVITAKVVNNGACGQFFPSISQGFRKLRIRLLDVHMNADYARLCHNLFLDNYQDFIKQSLFDQEITDWLSINFIGYTYPMAKRIAELLDTPSPRRIAGRLFTRPNAKLGDEGLINTLPRQMLEGFTVCHLTFGPQERKIRRPEWDGFRARYAEVGRKYLEN